MGARIRFEFDEGDQILYKYYYGLISLEDITESWIAAIKNDKIPIGVRGFVLDFRNAHFNFDHNRLAELTDFYKENHRVFGNTRIAFITETPDDIVYPILIQSADCGYESMPFSTFVAAKKWVVDGEWVLSEVSVNNIQEEPGYKRGGVM